MKVIKFRGKRKDNGEWVVGDLVHDCENQRVFIAYDQFAYTDTTCGIDRLISERYCEVDPATVSQDTSLKDDYGTEIWEHSIINVKIRDHVWNKVIVDKNVVIEFRDGRFGFEWSGEFASFNEFCKTATTFKVIGNKFDNPELLEEAS